MSDRGQVSLTEVISTPSMAASASDADHSSVDLAEALQVLQAQNRRSRYLLDLSYQWHLQHHANLKNIVLGLNKFAEALQERGVQGMQPLVLHENGALFQPYGEGKAPVDSNKFGTLHDFVLACGGSGPELQTALMQMTGDQFNTLQESSAEIALGVVVPWLLGSDRALLNVGAVFLLESRRKFPNIFLQPRNAQLVHHASSGLQRLAQENSDALAADEIAELRMFLGSAASKL